MIDIGANLLDDMFQGKYNEGKEYHPPDLDAVLQRAWEVGLDKIIITAGSLHESRAALTLARTHDRLFSTVGVHPTRCAEFESYPEGSDAYMSALTEVIVDGSKDGKVVAVGECGLDYDRLHFCDAATQQKWFRAQFSLAKTSGLPMFLHLRSATRDFLDIVKRNVDSFPAGGVVHSFDGTEDELSAVLELDQLHIGLNGCSLKTEENLRVVAKVPLNRLLIETDAPWCEIRAAHAATRHVSTRHAAKDKKKHDPRCLVKGRNEPCNIVQVLEVVAGARGEGDVEALARQVHANTQALFFSRTLSTGREDEKIHRPRESIRK